MFDISSFLYGIYYAGKLPSRAEIGEISKYLRTSGFVKGRQQEVEQQVAEKMAEMYQALHPEEEKKGKSTAKANDNAILR